MKFYIIKTPTIVQRLFSSYRWHFSSVPKEIYLTFDDGPSLGVTNFVLEKLKKHQKIYLKIQKEGYSLGNHTINHLNGLLTKNNRYVENIQQASVYIVSKLFRPPYGKLKSSQARLLQQEGYEIVMWDVLSGDFDKSIPPEKCLDNVLKNTTNGSIIVMHDSEKSKDKIYYALPRILDHFSQKGYLFKGII